MNDEEKRNFFEEKLRPLLDSEAILLDKSEEAINDGLLEDAITLLKGVLYINPDSQDAKAKINEINSIIRQLNKSSSEMQIKILSFIKNLTSKALLPLNIHNLGLISKPATLTSGKGIDTQKDTFSVGENIIITINAPEKDGYITTFLYDENDNLSMKFPKQKTDDSFIKANEEMSIGITLNEPVGKQYIKSIWTSHQIIAPDRINFESDSDLDAAIESYIDSISKMDSDDLIVSSIYILVQS